MSWLITTSVHAGETYDALNEQRQELDDNDRPLADLAARLAMQLLSSIGNHAIDEAVKVKLSGDGDAKVSIVVEAVPTEPREAHPNELGTGGVAEHPVVMLDEAEERAENITDVDMHAQYEATGSLLPDAEHPAVEIVEPPAEEAALSVEAPFEPGDFKAGDFTDETLEPYTLLELHEIRAREVAGQNRVTVLAKIDGTIAGKT